MNLGWVGDLGLQVNVPPNPNVKVKCFGVELIPIFNTIYIYSYIFHGLNDLRTFLSHSKSKNV